MNEKEAPGGCTVGAREGGLGQNGETMIGLIVRLTILFGVVFGVVYGLVRSAKKQERKRLDKEKDLVLERLRALASAKERGEMTQAEADELTWQVYLESKDKGIDLAREEVPGLDERAVREHSRKGERALEPQD